MKKHVLCGKPGCKCPEAVFNENDVEITDDFENTVVLSKGQFDVLVEKGEKYYDK